MEIHLFSVSWKEIVDTAVIAAIELENVHHYRRVCSIAPTDESQLR